MTYSCVQPPSDERSMPVLAALPMYDYEPMRAAAQRFWSGVRLSLDHDTPRFALVPDALGQPVNLWEHWQHSRLFFSQTCGYPYVASLHEKVQLLGTPDYGVVPDLPGWYCSEIVVRGNDMRMELSDFQGAYFACNARDSQSGCHAMMFEIMSRLGEIRLFKGCVLSGSHKASVAMVANGEADIAAIDAVTWQLLKRYLPAAAQLRVIGRTAPTPGLPYITAEEQDAHHIADAVEAGINRLSGSDCAILGIKGFKRSTLDEYMLIAERAVISAGVLDLQEFQ